MSKAAQPRGALLVGSIPFDNCTEVFENVSSAMGNHIRSLPDGETGERTNWVDWQFPKLLENADLEEVPGGDPEYFELKLLALKPGADRKNLKLGNLGYADVALASYEVFSKLKESDKVPQQCRFQVSLPTPITVPHLYVDPSLQEDFESIYKEKLFEELARIVASIPAEELAIQWDCAAEFAIPEDMMPTYIENVEEGIVERLQQLITLVPEGVDLGFHLCYGDAGHEHFCQPKDTTKLVRIANAICDGSVRSVSWIHLPVPRDRSDKDYFAPLAELQLKKGTELYLGLIHYTDGQAGAAKRIHSAQQFVKDFGVATECGFGRRPKDTLDRLMSIHTDVSAPIS